MRELIFGAMPPTATPETHVAAGAWCFTGNEHAFPGWWRAGQGFDLPDDPFTEKGTAVKSAFSSLEEAALAANGEVKRLIAVLGAELNHNNHVNYSGKFWEMALGPWLLLCVHMLVERQERVLKLAEIYENEELLVPILPADCPCFFTSLLDFMLQGVLSTTFNHYIFSRIVENCAPPAWRLRTSRPVPLRKDGKAFAEATPKSSPNLKQKLAERLRLLPFPKLKGFSLAECLRLSLAVRKNTVGAGLATEAGSATGTSSPSSFADYCGKPVSWVFTAEPVIRKTIPQILLGTLPKIPQSAGKLRGMTAAVSQDDAYRLRLAAWLEGGGRLFSVQHGANYGNLKVVGGIVFEYAQSAFISWGWRHHQGYPVQATPLPHPLMVAAAKKSAFTGFPLQRIRKDNGVLILVGTEMSSFLYRLKSRPLAKAQVEYRTAKLTFFNHLPSQIVAQAQYRPYPPVESGLQDAAFVVEHLPQIPVCTGDLQRHMENCRLLVLDHYGTTLHMALAGNVPLIAFWKPEDWAMEEPTNQALAMLRQAGILFDSPEEAAAHISSVWEELDAWWLSSRVQAARNYWCGQYALCMPPADKTLDQIWFETMSTL